MKSNTATTRKTGRQQEPSRLDLLQRVLLHNTSINTTLLRADVGEIYFRIKRTDPKETSFIPSSKR